MSATHHSKGQHHHSHAGAFLSTLTISQKNSLRLLLARDAAADLHYLLGVQKAVTRAVTEAEHKLALAEQGRTSELFRSSQHTHTDLKVRLSDARIEGQKRSGHAQIRTGFGQEMTRK